MLGVLPAHLGAQYLGLHHVVDDAVVEGDQVLLHVYKLRKLVLQNVRVCKIVGGVKPLTALGFEAFCSLGTRPELVVLVDLGVTVLSEGSEGGDQSLDAPINDRSSVPVNGDSTVAISVSHGRRSHARRKVRHERGRLCALVSQKSSATHLLRPQLVVATQLLVAV